MPELIDTSDTFSKKIQSQGLVIIHFAADWIEQCKQVDDILEMLSNKPNYSHVTFAKCAAEDLPEISYKYKIEAAPTVLIFKNSTEIDRIAGADPAKIASIINKHTKIGDSSDKELNIKLETLINRSKVMLFMKGDRDRPRCGFSRQIIEILNNAKVDYDTFDILSDEEVRQGLKSYSDWPTYPQLYVGGNLLGGLDVVQEMKQSGELESALKD